MLSLEDHVLHKGIVEEDWSTLNYFYLAGPSRNDLFETPIQSPSSPNARYVNGDTYTETPVVFDSPKVSRDACNVETTEGIDGFPIVIQRGG